MNEVALPEPEKFDRQTIVQCEYCLMSEGETIDALILK